MPLTGGGALTSAYTHTHTPMNQSDKQHGIHVLDSTSNNSYIKRSPLAPPCVREHLSSYVVEHTDKSGTIICRGESTCKSLVLVEKY